MIFGDKNEYAIELYHEPFDNDAFYTAGRMCLHIKNKMLGYIDDPSCPFNIPYHRLLDRLNGIEEIKNNFNCKTDEDIFNFLDVKLYLADDDTTYDQVVADAKEYRKYDFLTNGGEMFDGTKSFIYLDDFETVHILYQIFEENDKTYCSQIDKEVFFNVTKEFFKWYESTYNHRPCTRT